jgi:hypothetical protein
MAVELDPAAAARLLVPGREVAHRLLLGQVLLRAAGSAKAAHGPALDYQAEPVPAWGNGLVPEAREL